MDYRAQYLELLREKFPTNEAIVTELINLDAILHLPKGTELYMSDIHGEFPAFDHILRTGSGNIKEKMTELFGATWSEKEIQEFAILVAYPEETLQSSTIYPAITAEWYHDKIDHLIELLRYSAAKYTRSKVRKSLPAAYVYIIEELLYADQALPEKKAYYHQIIRHLIELEEAQPFMIELAKTIRSLTIDHVHVVGDIFDRGSNADEVMDRLLELPSLDIQWGNHDILWMGAFFGSKACLLNLLRIAARYGYLFDLEKSYGINLRPLFLYAEKTYQENKMFTPKGWRADTDEHKEEQLLIEQVHQALMVMQAKIEEQLLERRPEFKMDERKLLGKINYEAQQISLDGTVYALEATCFQTIDPENPSSLTDEENRVLNSLMYTFQHSRRMRRHIKFLLSHGAMYHIYNKQLLYHGCIPLDSEGDFLEFHLNGKSYYGQSLLEFFDEQIRLSAKNPYQDEDLATDLIWYAWSGKCSPLFGKSKMATFERYFIQAKETHKEWPNTYYVLRDQEEVCRRILANFGLNAQRSAIINGHTPVKVKKGESPIKANGKLFVIDGGLSKAYQETTGIAGYSLLYNSFGFQLVTHFPFESVERLLAEGVDKTYVKRVIESHLERTMIADTTIGTQLKEQQQLLRESLQETRSN